MPVSSHLQNVTNSLCHIHDASKSNGRIRKETRAAAKEARAAIADMRSEPGGREALRSTLNTGSIYAVNPHHQLDEADVKRLAARDSAGFKVGDAVTRTTTFAALTIAAPVVLPIRAAEKLFSLNGNLAATVGYMAGAAGAYLGAALATPFALATNALDRGKGAPSARRLSQAVFKNAGVESDRMSWDYGKHLAGLPPGMKSPARKPF